VNQSPGALLAALDEAVSAHLLTAAPDGLAFTHEFVRPAAAPPACGTRPPSRLTRGSASATEDQGVLLARSGDEDKAARVFDEALHGYASMGAGRDVARLRWRLRKLGIRRRHWSARKRPATGWESLTDTELATSRLVAQGMTNQQIAGQLLISTHTVVFHRRQVFRKLGITSRVELTPHRGGA
jgi:DNA-binding CsgD family transcriptional regulator